MASIFHDSTLTLASKANEAANTKFSGLPNDILHDAIFVLSLDSARVHRSIAALADAGWPSQAAVLLRTLLDLNVSVIALTQSINPNLAAFKYLYSGLRRLNRLPDFPAETRRHSREQIRFRLALLPDDLRAEAIAAVKDKDRPFWFSPEWGSPSAVLDQFAVPGIREFYSALSGVAHGGYFGMRLYRESPDAHGIDPELPGRRALSLDLQACRVHLEIVRIRDSIQDLGFATEIAGVIEEIRKAGLAMRLPAT